MSNDPDRELETIRDGLASPFWAWLTGHVEREWGPAGARYQTAVQAAAEMKDDNAVHMLRMVIFAKKEIDRLLTRPTERAEQLRGQLRVTLEPSTSRRGPGL